MDTPFTDKIESADVAKMPAEYQELLKRVLAIQADCEIGGPHLYVRSILPAAPTKVDQLIVARTAAEEADHYRKVARLSGEIGADVSHLLSRPNRERYVNAFRGEITSWEEFAVFGFLIDRVGRYQLEEFIGCSYAPLDRLLPTSSSKSWGTSSTVRTRPRSSRPGAERRRRGSSRSSTPGIRRLSTCSGPATRGGRSVTGSGDQTPNQHPGSGEYVREVDPLIAAMGLRVPDANVRREFV